MVTLRRKFEHGVNDGAHADNFDGDPESDLEREHILEQGSTLTGPSSVTAPTIPESDNSELFSAAGETADINRFRNEFPNGPLDMTLRRKFGHGEG